MNSQDFQARNTINKSDDEISDGKRPGEADKGFDDLNTNLTPVAVEYSSANDLGYAIVESNLLRWVRIAH